MNKKMTFEPITCTKYAIYLLNMSNILFVTTKPPKTLMNETKAAAAAKD